MFERFTDRARRVLVLAQEEARQLEQLDRVGTEHILLGLSDEGEGLAAKALERLGLTAAAIRERVQAMGPVPRGERQEIPFTPAAKQVLELSLREALQLGHNYIGTEHILLGIVREGDNEATAILQAMGAPLPRVRQEVIQLLSGYTGGSQPGRIQRKRAKGWKMPKGVVNVTRPARWSNPFVIGDYVEVVDNIGVKITRPLAVALFEAWVTENHLEDEIRKDLAGKDLCCWCAPNEACHADVLLRIARTTPPQSYVMEAVYVATIKL